MILPYFIDAALGVGVVTMAGRVRGADMADSMRAICSDPGWRSGFGVVWDGLAITELLFEKDDIAGFLALQRSIGGRAGPGRDVIVTHRPLDEAIAKLYIALVKDVRPTGLAKSRWEAVTALGSGR